MEIYELTFDCRPAFIEKAVVISPTGAAAADLMQQHTTTAPEEWDIERVLVTNSSALSLIGLTLGILGRRRWLLLPLVVQGFFLQHSIQGWCPPLPFLRRRGFRTQQEIEQERYALKALRGDFEAQKRTETDDPDARARFALRAAYAGQETAKETPS